MSALFAPARPNAIELERPDLPNPLHRAQAQAASEGARLIERKTCPCCQSTRVCVFYDESYAAAGVGAYLARHYEGRATPFGHCQSFRLSRCGDCGLAFQPLVPGSTLLQEIYDRWVVCAGTEPELDFDLNDYRYLDEQVQFMLQHLAKVPATHAEWAQVPPLQKRARLREHIEWAASQGVLRQVYEALKKLPENRWHHIGE